MAGQKQNRRPFPHFSKSDVTFQLTITHPLAIPIQLIIKPPTTQSSGSRFQFSSTTHPPQRQFTQFFPNSRPLKTMAKCVCPPAGGKGGKGGKGGAANGKAKVKRKGHPANMFILFFLATWRKEGGNIYCMARVCGQRWKTLPQSEKDKYKRQYCTKCKNCKSCTRKPAGGKNGGGKGKGAGGTC